MTAFVEEQHGSAMWALVMAVPAAAMLAFARSVPLAGIRLTLIVSAIILRGRNNGVERLSLFVQPRRNRNSHTRLSRALNFRRRHSQLRSRSLECNRWLWHPWTW